MPARVPQFFVLSSNMATTNTRAAGFVLTLLHQSISLPRVHWLGIAEGAREGPLTLWHKVNARGSFRPSGFWRGHDSGVRACCRYAGPVSKAKTPASRSRANSTAEFTGDTTPNSEKLIMVSPEPSDGLLCRAETSGKAARCGCAPLCIRARSPRDGVPLGISRISMFRYRTSAPSAWSKIVFEFWWAR